jgi:hypothetical protein
MNHIVPFRSADASPALVAAASESAQRRLSNSPPPTSATATPAAPMRLNMSSIGKDEQAAGDPLGAFEQRQGMRQNIVAVLGGEQRQADRHGERRLEIE